MGEIQIKLEKYIETLKTQLNIETIVIFGSYLDGRFTVDSDIDILVVAKEFSKMDKLEAFKILSKPIWDVKLNIDPIPASPEEIRDKQKASFLAEILNTGEIVYSRAA